MRQRRSQRRSRFPSLRPIRIPSTPPPLRQRRRVGICHRRPRRQRGRRLRARTRPRRRLWWRYQVPTLRWRRRRRCPWCPASGRTIDDAIIFGRHNGRRRTYTAFAPYRSRRSLRSVLILIISIVTSIPLRLASARQRRQRWTVVLHTVSINFLRCFPDITASAPVVVSSRPIFLTNPPVSIPLFKSPPLLLQTPASVEGFAYGNLSLRWRRRRATFAVITVA